MHIQSKLLKHTFVVSASSDLGQPFSPRQKKFGLVWGKNRLSRYDIRAEIAVPPPVVEIFLGLLDLQCFS